MNVSFISLKGIWLIYLIRWSGLEGSDQNGDLNWHFGWAVNQSVVPTLEGNHIQNIFTPLKKSSFARISQADSICNGSLRHHLLSLNGPLPVCQTGSPRTGRPSCARWSTWSTMTTSVMRHRQETPCEGHLTGRCTTSVYPSLWSCRRKTPVNPLSEFSSSWHIFALLTRVVQWARSASVEQMSSEARGVPLFHLLLFGKNNISISAQPQTWPKHTVLPQFVFANRWQIEVREG